LIALMNYSFDKSRMDAEINFVINRARLMREYECILCFEQHRFWDLRKMYSFGHGWFQSFKLIILIGWELYIAPFRRSIYDCMIPIVIVRPESYAEASAMPVEWQGWIDVVRKEIKGTAEEQHFQMEDLKIQNESLKKQNEEVKRQMEKINGEFTKRFEKLEFLMSQLLMHHGVSSAELPRKRSVY